VLHRAPDSGGLAFWSAQLDSGRLTRQEVALNIQGSEEGLQTQVNDLYRRFLGRTADPVGLALWTNFLRDDDNDVTDLSAQLIASPEYYLTQGGGTDAGFITAVYQDVLGRAPEPGAIAAWQGFLNDDGASDASDRLDLAEAVLESPEGRMEQVKNTYESYLRRAGDPGGVAFWTQELRDDDLDEHVNEDRVPGSVEEDDDVILVAEFLASQEYFQLAQTLPVTSFATIPGNPPITP
jgi:hypothetical protein